MNLPHREIGGVVFLCSKVLILSYLCVKLIVPNQLNINVGAVYLFKGIIALFFSVFVNEFDKNANSISMNAEMLFVLNWFGDYRSLRFLCGYFGSRTFCFLEVNRK